MNMAYFSSLVLPDILIAPGFSSDSEVAAVMAAKTTFSTVFHGTCICDISAATAKTYQAAAQIKNGAGSFQNKRQIDCWPMLALGDRTFHMSTQLAGAMGRLDAEQDNIPSRVASNVQLQADSAVLADGTEVLLGLEQANYLRGQGIVTAYNFVNGFTAWGAYTAAYPYTTDPKDMFINISRMFAYIANSVVLTYWSRIDENLTRRYAESITDELNSWLNGMTRSGHLLGARCELRAEDNPRADLMAGIVRVHIFMTPPSPAQEVDFLLEYDADYVSSILG
jgi:phage tail sheath protein FI